MNSSSLAPNLGCEPIRCDNVLYIWCHCSHVIAYMLSVCLRFPPMVRACPELRGS